MWFPCLAENRPDARRAGLGHLYENAFVFVRDHRPAAMEYGSSEVMEQWVGRDSNPEPTPNVSGLLSWMQVFC